MHGEPDCDEWVERVAAAAPISGTGINIRGMSVEYAGESVTPPDA